MLLDICYKALYNDITRSNYEKNEHKRLIEKSQKLDSIVATMKERGESAEYIGEVSKNILSFKVNYFFREIKTNRPNVSMAVKKVHIILGN